jgi:hypothetical protein
MYNRRGGGRDDLEGNESIRDERKKERLADYPDLAGLWNETLGT